MPRGDRIQLDIPGELAYGANGPATSTPPIPPNMALTFVIDVLSVEPADIEWPSTLPIETERTWLEHGPADGRESQLFDSLTVEFTSAILEVDEHPLAAILGLTGSDESDDADTDGETPTGVLADDGWLPPAHYQSPAINSPFGPQVMPLIPGTMGPGLEERCSACGSATSSTSRSRCRDDAGGPQDEPDIGALVVQVTVTDITGPLR